jgi:hypothetical protein
MLGYLARGHHSTRIDGLDDKNSTIKLFFCMKFPPHRTCHLQRDTQLRPHLEWRIVTSVGYFSCSVFVVHLIPPDF